MGFGRGERFHSVGSTHVISTGGRAEAEGEGAAVGTGATADGFGSAKNGDWEPVGSGGFLHESVERTARTAMVEARFTTRPHIARAKAA
jgi:hypothetical protein